MSLSGGFVLALIGAFILGLTARTWTRFAIHVLAMALIWIGARLDAGVIA